MALKKKFDKSLQKSIAIFLSLLLVTIISQSCKKDKDSDTTIKDDYRSSFIGDFDFTVCNTFWWMSPDSLCWVKDTILTKGSISLYHNNQLLIKYDSGNFTGIWRGDTIDCNGWAICSIEDSLINNPPNFSYSFFWGYFDSWVSPVIHEDSTMDITCIPFRLSGGVHIAFGGYFINIDSLYLFYSGGGLGAGSYRYVYGRRH